MESKDNSHRKTLAEKFSMDEKALENLSDSAINFIKYSNPRYFKVEFDSSSPRIIFKKAKWIRDYFKVTKEKNADYDGKIKMGKLSLTSEQFENYVSKKRKLGIYLIF